jgi:hypothetical protein
VYRAIEKLNPPFVPQFVFVLVHFFLFGRQEYHIYEKDNFLIEILEFYLI